MDTGDVDDLLARAYAVDGPEANRGLYAAWAATYDATFVAASGYVYHRAVAHAFTTRSTGGPVLDVGCGTGIVGVALREAGLGADAAIDGIDISPEMLVEAATKSVGGTPVYRQLIEADLTGPIDVPDRRYAGIVSAGTFTHGHLGPEVLDELFRVATAGACCVIGINAAHFEEHGFRSLLHARRRSRTITALELVEVPIYADVDPADRDQMAQLAIFTVT